MKKILIIIIIIAIISFGTLFVVAAYRENKIQSLINNSKVLSSAGKYQDALQSLNEANKLTPSDALLSEINNEVRKNELLVKSSDYFNKGKNYFDEQEYETAISFFKLVSMNDINYTAAQTYSYLAENKLATNQKGSVAGVSTTFQPSITTPNKSNNLEALCEADANSLKSKAALEFDQMIRKQKIDHSDTYNDPIWGPLSDAKFSDMKKQYDANVNNGADQMKIWCLEHNRDYSGFKVPEVKYLF